jgi:hypothetical protein
VLRDSVGLAIFGVSLPQIDLSSIGGVLDLGDGESTFSFRRVGEEIDAELLFTSDDVGWTRSGGTPPPATRPPLGTVEWARDLVWRTLTGVERVDLTMGLGGSLASPTLTISSNLGGALGESLRRELGQQIDEAETRLRAELEGHIQPLVQDARGRVDAVRTGVAERVAGQRQEIEALRARVEQRLRELTTLPGC